MILQTKLKSGYIWEYSDKSKLLRIGIPENTCPENNCVYVPRAKVRSLLCFLNRVAWHREIKAKRP